MPKMPALTQLGLRGAGVDALAVRAIAACSALETLDLANNSLGFWDTAPLAELAQLRELDLSGNLIDLKPLAPLPLRRLWLDGVALNSDALRGLVDFVHLTELDVSNNSIGDGGAAALAEHRGLMDLNVRGNEIGDRGAIALAQMVGLRRLGLADNDVTDAGAAALVANESIGWIDPADNAIRDPGGLAADPSRVCLEGNPAFRVTPDQVRARQEVMAEIHAAFDGAHPPDATHLSLYQAEAADSYEECDKSRDHFGRWQDLPESHLEDCQSALSYLDEQGYAYYLPAIMTDSLRSDLAHGSRGLGHLSDSVLFHLSPSHYDGLHSHAFERMRLLNARQRLAIARFVEVSANARDVELIGAWRRVVAFDMAARDDGSCEWFDTFWPRQTRPTSAAVRQLIEAWRRAAAALDSEGWFEALPDR